MGVLILYYWGGLPAEQISFEPIKEGLDGGGGGGGGGKGGLVFTIH